MGRPRTVDDEVLLEVALRIVRETGPDSLSFGALAARVDLAASTLVQRFGSKQNLLRAALLIAWNGLDQATAKAAGEAGRGAGGVVDLLVALTGQHDEDDFADQLLILREDLRDPILRARGQAWVDVLTEAIEQRLRTRGCNVDGIGQLVVTHWQGALTLWAFQRNGPLDDTVRSALHRLFDQLQIA